MRCEYCGNHGVRGGQYCTCPYGMSKKITDGNHEMRPELKAIMDQVMEKHHEAFKRLAQN